MKTSMFLRWLEARVAQLAERRIRNAKVGSSILPAGSFMGRLYRLIYARVAQLAERRIRNAKVGSSILPAGLKPSFSVGAAFFISWGRSFISPNPSYSGRMSLVMAGSLVL